MRAFLRFRRHFKANYYSTVAAAWTHEVVHVPVRSNGSVTIGIHHPTSPPIPQSNSRLIFYLPRGPIPGLPQKDDVHVASSLARGSGFPVVTLNYRLSRSRPFPTPVHDILAGYDWCVQNLLPVAGHRCRLGVIGEHVGGTLALALALTECRRGQARIAAADVNEAICDWVFEGQQEGKKSLTQDTHDGHNRAAVIKQESKEQLLSWNLLSDIRERFFPPDRPYTYFDPFASPIHLLRTPSAPVPPRHSLEDDFAALVALNQDSLGVEPWKRLDDKGQPQKTSRPTPSANRFKRPLRFPPMGIDAHIPKVNIRVREDSMLRNQNEELFQKLQRAVIKNSQRMAGVGDKLVEESCDEETQSIGKDLLRLAIDEAKSRASLSIESGESTGPIADGQRIAEAGAWFREVLGQS